MERLKHLNSDRLPRHGCGGSGQTLLYRLAIRLLLLPCWCAALTEQRFLGKDLMYR